LNNYDGNIDAVMEAITPKGSAKHAATKGKEVKGDTFTVPKLLERNEDHPFNFYVPPHYDQTKPMGLIVWMHGGGTYKPGANVKRRSVEGKLKELAAGDYILVAAEARLLVAVDPVQDRIRELLGFVGLLLVAAGHGVDHALQRIAQELAALGLGRALFIDQVVQVDALSGVLDAEAQLDPRGLVDPGLLREHGPGILRGVDVRAGGILRGRVVAQRSACMSRSGATGLTR